MRTIRLRSLLRRLEQEAREQPERQLRKVVPALGGEDPGGDLYLRCFDDVYGFRAKDEGHGRQLYYLSPWEFLMLWECVPLPRPGRGRQERGACALSIWSADGEFGPNPAAESKDIVTSTNSSDHPTALKKKYQIRADARSVLYGSAGVPGSPPRHRRTCRRRSCRASSW